MKTTMSKSKIKASIEQRYFLYFNGKECNFSNCPWLNIMSVGGCKTREEAVDFFREAKECQKRYGAIGDFLAVTKYVVLIGEKECGPMYNFGIGPISGKGKRRLMMQFPYELEKFNSHWNKEEAELLKDKLQNYIDDVCSVAPEYRAGSSKDW